MFCFNYDISLEGSNNTGLDGHHHTGQLSFKVKKNWNSLQQSGS